MTRRDFLIAGAIMILFTLGGITGYGYAARHFYDHCLDEWKIAMTDRDPVEVHDWGDWPGRHQCYGYTSDSFGTIGRVWTPSPGPNPHPEDGD